MTYLLVLFMFSLPVKAESEVQLAQIEGFSSPSACDKAAKDLLAIQKKHGQWACVGQREPQRAWLGVTNVPSYTFDGGSR